MWMFLQAAYLPAYLACLPDAYLPASSSCWSSALTRPRSVPRSSSGRCRSSQVIGVETSCSCPGFDGLWSMELMRCILHTVSHIENKHTHKTCRLLFVLPGLLQSASRLCPLGLSLRPMAEAVPSRTITGSLLVAAPPCTSADSLGLGVLPEHSAADTSIWAGPPSPRKSEY